MNGIMFMPKKITNKIGGFFWANFLRPKTRVWNAVYLVVQRMMHF